MRSSAVWCAAVLRQQASEYPRGKGAGVKKTRQLLHWRRPSTVLELQYVAYGGVARGPGLLLPRPFLVRVARDGATEMKFSSRAEGTQVSRCGGRDARRERKS